ncbi:MAG: hypothetical protein VB875_01655 [Pirellulales bacterium]
MFDEFDPYAEWLGIPASEQPADHYRLLGIARYESDHKVISAAAGQRAAYLRSFQTADHADALKTVLNAVSAAKVCLLNPLAKAGYDAQLPEALQASSLSPVAPPSSFPPAETDPMLPVVHNRATVYRAADAGPSEPLPRGTGIPLSSFLVSSGIIIGILVALVIFVKYRKSQSVEIESVGPSPIELPEQSDESLAGKTVIVPEGVVAQGADGYVVLECNMATVNGAETDVDVIEWNTDVDSVIWQFLVNKPGFFRFEVTYAAAETAVHGSVEMTAAGRTVRFRVRNTGGWDSYVTDPGKTIAIKRGGRYRLVVKPKEMPDGTRLINLKQIRLKHIPSGRRPTK